MSRNFECPATGELCSDGRCTKDSCQQDREINAKAAQAIANDWPRLAFLRFIGGIRGIVSKPKARSFRTTKLINPPKGKA